MKMIKKLVFLVAFTVVHLNVTLTLLGRAYNSAGVSAVLVRLNNSTLFVLLCPVALPMMISDPDGDRTPKWLQWCAFGGNSLIWAIAVLLLFMGIRRLCRRRQTRSMANNTIEETSR